MALNLFQGFSPYLMCKISHYEKKKMFTHFLLFIRYNRKAHQEMPGSLAFMFRNVKPQQRQIYKGFPQTHWQNFGYGQRGKLENVDLKMSERALVSFVYCKASRFIGVLGVGLILM